MPDVRIYMQGDKVLMRKLNKLADGRTRHRIVKKAVWAGLTPIVKDIRRRIPDVGDEALTYRFRRTAKTKQWDTKIARRGLAGLLRSSVAKRRKAYIARGIVWGGVGIKTRIKIRPPGWRMERALTSVAWDIEHGTAYKPPQPFVRPAFDSQKRAALNALIAKARAELLAEAKRA